VTAATPGQHELHAARRFFGALRAGDRQGLAALLDERPSLYNIDGPVPVVGAEALCERLLGRDRRVDYELVEVAAAPGRADVRFLVRVDDAGAAIVLEAVLGFAGERIASIHVHQP
jgi:hypothetical protein